MMKKNVTAEGEELGINERLISSELGVHDFYITPFVSLHFLTCNFLTLEKKLKIAPTQRRGNYQPFSDLPRWYYLPYIYLN